jgi:hypothetical protein
MFNPQRKSKLADIYMEERTFQLHLEKLGSIRRSASPRDLRLEEERSQRRYLSRLQMSKKEVQGRLKGDVDRQNHKLLGKLTETDRRHDEHPESKGQKKHFNSYFNSRRESQRIRGENTGIISRMVQRQSAVPSLGELKKDFKQSKRYGKMVRKLPSILKHEEQFKRDLSASRRLHESKTSLRSRSSRRPPATERSSAHLTGRGIQ